MTTTWHSIDPRPLGTRNVAALGLGCWAIGGPWRFDGRDAGWGEVDDAESVRAIRRALDLGVTLFDTADVYGCGHSERVLGRALAGRRDEAVIATKFGHVFDEATREGAGVDASPAAARRACEASLQRLGTDRIDLLQLHAGGDEPGEAEAIVETLEALVAEGKIRAYGTSNEVPRSSRRSRAAATASASSSSSTSSGQRGGAGRVRAPRAGRARPLAAGDGAPDRQVPSRRPSAGAGDVRRDTPWWDYFDDGAFETWYARLESIRDALTTGGRTLAQGALGWIWARSPVTIPIPGFRTVAQVEENIAALTFGPLPADAVAAIDAALAPA